MAMDSIKVGVRVRPLLERETKKGIQWRWSSTDIGQIGLSSCYNFDHVFGPKVLTESIYSSLVKPIVNSALEGFNGTVFAYGQTSSGKTHTMFGNEADYGIIPLSIEQIFSVAFDPNSKCEYIIRVSYMEIYNETLTDLLSPGNTKIKIREDTERNVRVMGITEQTVVDSDEIVQQILKGNENRTIGATQMNDKSSRSHTILTINIESRLKSEEEADGVVKVSALNLVDLAGSERVSETGSEGLRFKEGTHINLSLLGLGNVISKLSEGHSHVPFRDTKLTRILQSSLGGNARTCMICNVTPAEVGETHSTLKFAGRAMRVKNKPVVNQVLVSEDKLLQRLREMEKENQTLHSMLNKGLSVEERAELDSKLKNTEEEKVVLEKRLRALEEMLKSSAPPSIPQVAEKAEPLPSRRKTMCVFYNNKQADTKMCRSPVISSAGVKKVTFACPMASPLVHSHAPDHFDLSCFSPNPVRTPSLRPPSIRERASFIPALISTPLDYSEDSIESRNSTLGATYSRYSGTPEPSAALRRPINTPSQSSFAVIGTQTTPRTPSRPLETSTAPLELSFAAMGTQTSPCTPSRPLEPSSAAMGTQTSPRTPSRPLEPSSAVMGTQTSPCTPSRPLEPSSAVMGTQTSPRTPSRPLKPSSAVMGTQTSPRTPSRPLEPSSAVMGTQTSPRTPSRPLEPSSAVMGTQTSPCTPSRPLEPSSAVMGTQTSPHTPSRPLEPSSAVMGTQTTPGAPPSAMGTQTTPGAPPSAMGIQTTPGAPPSAMGTQTTPGAPPSAMGTQTTPGAPPSAMGTQTTPGAPPSAIGTQTTPGAPPSAMGTQTTPGVPPSAMGTQTTPGAPPSAMGTQTTPGVPPSAMGTQTTPGAPPSAMGTQTTPGAPPSAMGTHPSSTPIEAQRSSAPPFSQKAMLDSAALRRSLPSRPFQLPGKCKLDDSLLCFHEKRAAESLSTIQFEADERDIQLEELQQQLKDSETAFSEKDTQCLALEAEAAALRKQLCDMEIAGQAQEELLVTLQDKLATKAAEEQDKLVGVTKLAGVIEERDQLAARVTEEQDKLAGVTEERDQLAVRVTEEHDKLAGVTEERDQLAARVTEEQDKLAGVTEERDQLAARVTEEQDKLAGVTEEQDKLAGVTEEQDKLAGVTEEQDKLAGVTEEQDKLAGVTEERDQLAARVTEEQDKLAGVTEERDQLVARVTEEQDKLAGVTEERDQLAARVTEEQDKLAGVTEERDQLAARVTEEQDKLAGVTEERDQLVARVTEEQDKLAGVTEERDQLAARVTEEQDKLAGVTEERDQLAVRVTEEQDKLAGVTEERDQLAGVINERDQLQDKLQDQLKHYQDMCGEVEQEIPEFREALTTLYHTLTSSSFNITIGLFTPSKPSLAFEESVLEMTSSSDKRSECIEREQEERIAELERQLSDYKEETQDLLDKLERLSNESTQGLENLEREKNCISEQLENLTADYDEVTAEYSMTKEELSNSKLLEAQCKDEIEQLKKELENIRGLLATGSEENAVLVSELEKERLRSEDLASEARQQQLDLTRVTEQRDQLEEEFQTRESLHREQLEHLEAEVEMLSGCKLENAELLCKLEKLSTESERENGLLSELLTEVTGKLDRVTEERDKAEDELSKAEFMERDLESKIERLEKKLEEVSKAPAKKLEEQLAKVKAKLDNVTEERDKFEDELSRAEFTERELECKIEQLEKKLEQTSKAPDTELEEQLAMVKAKLDSVTEERDKFEDELSRAEFTERDLECKIEQLEKKLEEASKSAAKPDTKLEEQLAMVKVKLDGVTEERDKFEDELSRAEFMERDLECKIERLEKKLEEACGAPAELEEKLAKVKSKLEKVTEERDKADDELSKAEFLERELEDKIEQLEKELEEARKTLANRPEKNTVELEERLAKVTSKLEKVTEERDRADDELSKAEFTERELEFKIEQLEKKQLEEASKVKSDSELREQLTKMKAKLEKVTEECENAEDELSKAEFTERELEFKIEQLEEELKETRLTHQKTLEQIIQQSEQKYLHATKVVTSYKEENRELSRKLDRLSAKSLQNADLCMELAKVKAKLEKVTEERDKADDELSRAEFIERELECKIEQLEKKLEQASKSPELAEQLAKVKAKLDKVTEERDNFEDELSKAEFLEVEHEQTIEKLEKELANVRTSRPDDTAALASKLKKQVQSLETEAKCYQHELSKVTRDRDKLNEKLQQSQLFERQPVRNEFQQKIRIQELEATLDATRKDNAKLLKKLQASAFVPRVVSNETVVDGSGTVTGLAYYKIQRELGAVTSEREQLQKKLEQEKKLHKQAMKERSIFSLKYGALKEHCTCDAAIKVKIAAQAKATLEHSSASSGPASVQHPTSLSDSLYSSLPGPSSQFRKHGTKENVRPNNS